MTQHARDPIAAEDLDLARECVYRFLSTIATDPRAPGWERVLDPSTRDLAIAAMEVVREAAQSRPIAPANGEQGAEALDLRPLADALSTPLESLQAQYDRVVGLVASREFPPYETEYDREGDPFQGAQQLADVAGFYEAFGLRPSRNHAERPDHLALELEFLALLLTKKRLAGSDPDRAAVCVQALRDFVADHLAWWSPTFAARLAHRAGETYLAPFATALSAFVAAERALLEIPTPRRVPMPRLPIIADADAEDAQECGDCVLAPS